MENFTFDTGGFFLEHSHTLLLETVDGKPQLAALLHIHSGSVTPKTAHRVLELGQSILVDGEMPREQSWVSWWIPGKGLGSSAMDGTSRVKAPAEPLSLLKAKGCLTGAESLLEPKVSQGLPSSTCFSITRGLSSFLRANPLLRLLGFEFTATGGVEPPGQMVMC